MTNDSNSGKFAATNNAVQLLLIGVIKAVTNEKFVRKFGLALVRERLKAPDLVDLARNSWTIGNLTNKTTWIFLKAQRITVQRSLDPTLNAVVFFVSRGRPIHEYTAKMI